MLRRLLPIVILCSLFSLLAGCYRVPVAQGNFMTQEKINQIHVGMTAQEVLAVFGTPLLHNIYVENRMIYVYSFRPTYGSTTEKRFIIYFNGGKVSSFTTDPHSARAKLPMR